MQGHTIIVGVLAQNLADTQINSREYAIVKVKEKVILDKIETEPLGIEVGITNPNSAEILAYFYIGALCEVYIQNPNNKR